MKRMIWVCLLVFGFILNWDMVLAADVYVESSGSCGGKTPCYSTIQAAINVANSGDTIKLAQGIYAETFVLDSDKQLILNGGWDTGFTKQTPGTTSIRAPIVSNGAISFQELRISEIAGINIDYSIVIANPSSHSMHVIIVIDGLKQFDLKDLTIGMVAQYYHLDDVLTNLIVKNEHGSTLPVVNTINSDGSFKIITLKDSNKITIEYDLLQDYRDCTDCSSTGADETRIDNTYAIFPTTDTLYKPQLPGWVNVEPIDVYLNMPNQWNIITNMSKINDTHYVLSSLDEISDSKYGLVRTSVIAAGDMTQREIYFDGVSMRLAIFNKVFQDAFPITMNRFAEVSMELYRFYTDYFGGRSSDAPILILTPDKAGHIYGNNIVAQCVSGLAPENNQQGQDLRQANYPWNFSHHMAHCFWINTLAFPHTEESSPALMKEGINTYTNILSFDYANLWQDYKNAWLWVDPNSLVHQSSNEMFNGMYQGYINDPNDEPLSTLTRSPLIFDKGASFTAFLNHELMKVAQKSWPDFFRYLFQQNGGYNYSNPSYVVNVDKLLEELNNFTPEHDWTDLFKKYVYGLEKIPNNGL